MIPDRNSELLQKNTGATRLVTDYRIPPSPIDHNTIKSRLPLQQNFKYSGFLDYPNLK